MTLAGGLVYYLDHQPGIARQKWGRGFRYIAPDGTTVDRGPERDRLDALAVPPAYEDVWICPLENGHLQATGRDARKRKQYRYHPDWSAAQAATKFDTLPEFGRTLPRLRRRVMRDLKEKPGSQDFALASAILLIDKFALRVGSEDYARENGSYGAVTLRDRHMRLDGNVIKLNYTAKGGQKVRRQLSHKTLARALHKSSDLPGAEVLTWVDGDETRTLSSTTLNDYIGQASGLEHVTAKTFRTWAGSVAAFEVASSGQATIKDIAGAAAERLHNTHTIARNSYIHPDIIELAGGAGLDIETSRVAGLTNAEARLLAFLDGSEN